MICAHPPGDRFRIPKGLPGLESRLRRSRCLHPLFPPENLRTCLQGGLNRKTRCRAAYPYADDFSGIRPAFAPCNLSDAFAIRSVPVFFGGLLEFPRFGSPRLACNLSDAFALRSVPVFFGVRFEFPRFRFAASACTLSDVRPLPDDSFFFDSPCRSARTIINVSRPRSACHHRDKKNSGPPCPRRSPGEPSAPRACCRPQKEKRAGA